MISWTYLLGKRKILELQSTDPSGGWIQKMRQHWQLMMSFCWVTKFLWLRYCRRVLCQDTCICHVVIGWTEMMPKLCLILDLYGCMIMMLHCSCYRILLMSVSFIKSNLFCFLSYNKTVNSVYFEHYMNFLQQFNFCFTTVSNPILRTATTIIAAPT